MDWIDVNDRLPEHFEGFKKYRVKVREGSMSPKIKERMVLGKHYLSGFRFMVGDWSTVTHWLPAGEE
jgi:hypothetical protein